jgi:hypothetical protein
MSPWWNPWKFWMMVGLVSLAAIAAPRAHAGCITSGPNPSSPQQIEHKLGHVAINTLAVVGGAAVTGNVWAGVGLGVAISLAREAQKATTPGMACEYSSMGADALGIALGAAAVVHWDIGSSRREAIEVKPIAGSKDKGVAVAYTLRY